MGLDFIIRCAATFQRAWDRGREELAEPDLFSGRVEQRTRRYLAVPLDGFTFVLGQELLGQVDRGQIVLYKASCAIGRISGPPPDLLSTIRSAGSDVCLAVVAQVHELSGNADVVLR